MNRSFIGKLVLLVMIVLVPVVYSALIEVTVNTSETTIPEIGQEFQITIVADIDEASAIIGWGLDLVYDEDYLEIAGPVVVGNYWQPVSSSVGDGDGMSGLAFPNAISGKNIVLFVITMKAIQQGTTEISVNFDDVEDFEGFWLNGSYNGPASDVSYVSQSVTILPEPTTVVLLGSGLLIFMKRR